ncbi:MAG: flagellar export chaperone FliS [Mycobacteriales bacterium]
MYQAQLGAARAQYTREAVTTASPARLLIMLYDRLIRDLVTAETALTAGDNAKASSELVHAQQIILELRTSLDLDSWDGAAGLADLYTYLHTELVGANLDKNTTRVTTCREIIEPLRDTWRQAALQALQPA